MRELCQQVAKDRNWNVWSLAHTISMVHTHQYHARSQSLPVSVVARRIPDPHYLLDSS